MELNPQDHCLISLVVFQHTIKKELVRSLHVYQSEDGRKREVERGFLFRKKGSYVEWQTRKRTMLKTLPELEGLSVSELYEGKTFDLWVCILVFHSHRLHPPSSSVNSLLCISRNPKLKSIPSLTDDLEKILKIISKQENTELEMWSGDKEDFHDETRPRLPVFNQDLNCFPDSTSGQSEIRQTEPRASDSLAKKKKRTPSEHIARLALEDLAKYFDLPLVEASRNLNVGLTVLKKKCREFGIPRWPHRKIKSLDSLIHDLQEEAELQQKKNKAAAMAVAKRQKMLERERQDIERKPFMEIQSETKRFRQDIFKRRHLARAHKSDMFTSRQSSEEPKELQLP